MSSSCNIVNIPDLYYFKKYGTKFQSNSCKCSRKERVDHADTNMKIKINRLASFNIISAKNELIISPEGVKDLVAYGFYLKDNCNLQIICAFCNLSCAYKSNTLAATLHFQYRKTCEFSNGHETNVSNFKQCNFPVSKVFLKYSSNFGFDKNKIIRTCIHDRCFIYFN